MDEGGGQRVGDRDGTFCIGPAQWPVRTRWDAWFALVWSVVLLPMTPLLACEGGPDGPVCAVAFALTAAGAATWSVSMLMRRSRRVRLGPDSVRLVGAWWPRPCVPYASVQCVRLVSAKPDRCMVLEVLADGGRLAFSADQPGWPRMVALLIQRVPSLRLRVPAPLEARLRALAGGHAEPLVLAVDGDLGVPCSTPRVVLKPEHLAATGDAHAAPCTALGRHRHLVHRPIVDRGGGVRVRAGSHAAHLLRRRAAEAAAGGPPSGSPPRGGLQRATSVAEHVGCPAAGRGPVWLARAGRRVARPRAAARGETR